MRREVTTVPCVLDTSSFPPPAAKSEVGLDPGKFTFLYIFDANSSIERKNPEAVIRAFAQSFSPGEGAQLVLRVANARGPDHRERLKRLLRTAPRGLDIALVLEEMSHRDLLRLLSAADCYVSLHRAEGFGYTCAEAMAYGKPVIATGYSGNLQFMSRDNSYLVDYEEREVTTADGPFQRGSVWAEPSVEHAAHLMQTVYRDRDAAAEVARRGRCDVLRQLSVETIGRIAAQALGG
jgi:glycosyltransferase involved in cell wall biosynthesis